MKTRDSSFLIVSLIALTFTALLEAKLLLNDSFSNFDNWTPRSDGSTGVIKITNSLSEETSSSQTSRKFPQMLFTNISQCVEGERCYRAMAYIKPKLRSTLIPTCHEQYWLGFSLYFPTSWGYKQGDSVDTSYHFELQSGDAREVPALLDLVVSKGKMSVSVCGNTKRHSSAVCHSYALGQLVRGEWVDLVVNSQLAYGSPTGWIKVWRNNVLMVDEKNILTAYNDIMPPYLIAGSYQLNWRYYQSVGYSWLATYYGSVRLGNSASSYDEVYTGDGSQCGDACSVESAALTWFTSEYLWGFIPLGLVIVFSIILYLGSVKYRARQWSLPETTEEKPVTEEEAEREANDLAYNHFLGGKDPFNMTDDDKKKHQKSAWFTPISEFKASFRHTSQTRTIFWYLFAFCCVLIMLFLGILLYGIPESSLVKVRPLYGAIPVNALQNWSVMELSMAAISGTMICIYFLPLFYLQHDFEAGKQWKNDPNFLKRIGVIIPCHKSAGEIGEVLRRALKYFPPENIVVCDNGNFDWPPDNTFEVVKAMNPRIRYLYIKQGHKTRALWTGVHRLPARVEYVIHLDDDTHFDEDHMVFDEKHFEEKHVIAIAFLRSSYPTNTVTQYTDFWYKITDHFHATQAKIATRCFVPGPAGMWKRDKFMEIFGKHPSLPFGEDIFGGFTTLNNGYAIRSETRCMVKTFAPDVLVPWCINMGNARVQGYGASSLWKQRAHRWTVSALRITGKSLYSFFTYDTKLGLFSNIAFRLYRFREYKLILAQLFYLPFCLVLFARGFFLEFILLKLMLFALPLSRNFFINYVIWRNQPQLQTSLKTVLLSPFFNFFLICCAIHGRWKCILWYLPCVAPNHGMLQRTRPRAIKDVPVEDSDELLLNYQSNSQSLDPALLASQSNDESVISFATLTDIALNPHAEAAASPITASPIREDFQLEGVPDHTDVEATEVNGNTFRFRHDKYFELFDREEGRSKFVYFIPAAVRGELLRKRELMMTSNSSNDLMLMMLEEGKQRSFDAEESSIIRPRSIRRMSFGSPDSTILRTPSVSFINSAESKTTARKRSRFGFSSFSKSHSTDVDLFISPVPALSLSADSAGSITQLYLSPEIYTGENDVIVQAEAPVPMRTPIKFNEGDVIRL